MSRRYREHRHRSVTSLDGYWDFAFLGAQDPDAVDAGAIVYSDRLPVPGCFDAMPSYAGCRGLAAYRTVVDVQPGLTHRLVFHGVSHWCRVFANGTLLREHAGGFTRFTVDLPDDKPEVEITVLVSSAFDAARNPLHLDFFDWYQFGEISRSVELQRLPAAWIESCRIVTADYSAPRLQIAVALESTVEDLTAALEIDCDGETIVTQRVKLQAGRTDLAYTIDRPGAALWSPEAPHLHMLDVRLGGDDLRVRFGIRQIAVDGQKLLLNGQPLCLLGFNRHEFHPQFGHALPDAIIAADVQQLRDLGCNFVRGSHYPQDERFLDLCDEAGICVWSEGIGWQYKADHLTRAAFIEAQIAHLDEMVAMAANHASVILWGILNESDSDNPACLPVYERLIGRLKAQDPTRPVTYATHRPMQDVCLRLADVISVNTYPGWYFGSLESIPAELDKIADFLDAAGFGGKPLLISEIGAGAIPGWRDSQDVRWTEQYQAALLDTVIQHLFMTRTRYAGLALWLFNDFRTPNQTQAVLARPRGYNDKGVVDEYRRPKQAYLVVRERFAELRKRPIE